VLFNFYCLFNFKLIFSFMALLVQVHISKQATPGDILVFLPGQEDIEDASMLLKSKFSAMHASHLLQKNQQKKQKQNEEEVSSVEPAELLSMLICPMYASLSPDAQLKAFAPTPPGSRKVILATNIAETSVTINGVRVVIDTGKVKIRSFSTSSVTGMESLTTTNVSKAQATQRTGRAGREAPGECYRLYTSDDFDSFSDESVAEITRISIASTLLALFSMRMSATQVINFPWLESPPKASLHRALILLFRLGALVCQVNGSPVSLEPELERLFHQKVEDASSPVVTLSPLGLQMSKLPLEPMYSMFVFQATKMGAGVEAIALVSLLSLDTGIWVFSSSAKPGMIDNARKKFVSLEGDHLTMLNVFRSFEKVVETSTKAVINEISASIGTEHKGRGEQSVKTFVLETEEEEDEAPDDVGGVQEWMQYSSQSSGKKYQGDTSASSTFSSLKKMTHAITACLSSSVSSSSQPHKFTFKRLLSRINSKINKWCSEHFISVRAMRRAVAVRDQLYDMVTGVCGSPPSSCKSDTVLLLRALVASCWLNVAYKVPVAQGNSSRPEYRTSQGIVATVHPSSSLTLAYAHIRAKQMNLIQMHQLNGSNKSKTQEAEAALQGAFSGYPDVVIYSEIVKTSKVYMRHVSKIEKEWLKELHPESF
jgi:HrpA-like RNA helicase